jgi:lactoylglutathione lyase
MALRARLMHAMLRVADMDRTLDFYCGKLGMAVRMERTDPDGYRNTFVGYGDPAETALIEFASRPGVTAYDKGTGFDHIALEVDDVAAVCATLKSSGVKIVREVKTAASGALIAIIEDPDGYRIELIQLKR